ncbi:hypothetical protein OSB04_011288 [Centaurea solstitialis]|uniref:Uncharacterized protein n=1 Tax=Centaurea solstitialis TaxID=347529 RepID=A0AA38TAV7_9ASTR|nr:hypothetical protein OSB04_011288 [Centaurea solstitialis]
MLQSNGQFAGLANEDPHAHLRSFMAVSDCFKLPGVSDDALQLKLFLYSLSHKARKWNAQSRNDICTFQQLDGEAVPTAWERFKELLRKCPHHGIPYCIQLETFYNGLNEGARQMLDATAGGAFTTRSYNEGYLILERISNSNGHWVDPGQMALEIKNRPTGSLPSDTETPQRAGTPIPKPATSRTKSPTSVPSYVPYPQRLRNQKEEIQFKKILDIFKQLHINIPLVEAIEQMPNYAKFLKDILSKKKKLTEYETIALTKECSALVTNKIPPKLKDPGSFTIPCSIVMRKTIGKALCDLGAGINLMPLSVFKSLEIGEARPTTISIQLADKSLVWPKGKIEDVLVQVDKFIFPADFIILDCEVDADIPIILGRPFLATGRTLIDVQKGELTMRVQDQEVTFSVLDSLRYPGEREECSTLSTIESFCQDRSIGEILGMTMSDSEEEDDFEDLDPPLVNAAFEVLENKDRKTLVPSLEVPPNLELKQLPSHLKYAFLEKPDKLPVIISSTLEEDQENQLIQVLKQHTKAIGWTIADLKGISPTICQHKIILEDTIAMVGCRHNLLKRRLNPVMKEVVKKEILKWLDADIIYPIASSSCVSPVQCVPKKGGVTVITNEKNEIIPTRTVTGWRICMDYMRLNKATQKDHFPLPFIDQMLDRLAGKEFYCFLDGYSGYNQIAIAPDDQEKTTFTCPYGTFAFRRMPFGLCNAPATF